MPSITIPDKKPLKSTPNLFSDCFSKLLTDSYSGYEIESDCKDLQNQIPDILSGLTDKKEEVTRQFFENLKKIKKTLNKDANFILESDPAATQLIEVIAIYPGFLAIFCYRIANAFAQLSIPLFPRMITEYAHKVTGIDIHPHAEIGCPFAIDHGTGIVIGETTNIGNNVKLYQGVTLGALSVDKSKASKKRHPPLKIMLFCMPVVQFWVVRQLLAETASLVAMCGLQKVLHLFQLFIIKAKLL